METITVKGSSIGGVVSADTPALLIGPSELALLPANNVGDALSSLPGVANSQFGPNAGRPVVRGLDGDKIRILQNGTALLDASAASPDHAVGVDPLSLREMQIYRGPSALLYSTSVLGGVVNLTDNRIAAQRMGTGATLAGRTGSVDNLAAGGVKAHATAGDWVVHADGFARSTDDLRTPVGRITDSGSEAVGGGFGVSKVWEGGFVGISWSALDNDYGVAEPGIVIGQTQRRWEVAGEAGLDGAVRKVSWRAGITDYEHTEFEGGMAGSTFANQGFDARIDLTLARIGSTEAVIGVQGGSFDFEVTGDEAFLPTTTNRSAALFGSFVTPFASPGLRLRYGFRVQRDSVSADAWTHDGVVIDPPAARRSFTPLGLSAALEKDLGTDWRTTLTVSRVERAPNYQELFADGPHVGTDAYEVGDRDLGKERGYGIEWEVARVTGRVTGSVSAFYNRYSSFITLIENGYGPDLSGTGGPDFSSGGLDELVRYDFTSVPAHLYGAEARLNYAALQAESAKVNVELFADTLRASRRDGAGALPRISPGRVGLGLNGLLSGWDWKTELAYFLTQDDPAADESRTSGYPMLSASLGHSFRLAGADARLTLRGINLLDREARNPSSFIKDLVPLPGRGVELGLRLTF
ncbi:MAG: TonB-dependent receptor [Verrucomicrobiota bacterium]